MTLQNFDGLRHGRVRQPLCTSVLQLHKPIRDGSIPATEHSSQVHVSTHNSFSENSECPPTSEIADSNWVVVYRDVMQY